MMRMAVVGVGSMGRNHCRVLLDTPNVELVAVADRNLDTARDVVRKSGVPIFSDHDEMLEAVRPQAVVIAVPTALHYVVAMAAIERGIHVLVEKPIANTTEEGERMIAAAEKHRVVLAVGHIERFNPAVLELKRRIDAGELGRVFTIHSRRKSPFPRRIMDVGVANDLATHELDMIRYLAGADVSRLSAEVAHVLGSAHEDIVLGLFRFANGVIGILDVNWVTPTTVRELTITGERGMFVVNYMSQELFFHENPAAIGVLDGSVWMPGNAFSVEAGHMTRFQINRREPLRSELESFIDAVQTGKPAAVDGNAGLEALRLAQQILECGRIR